MKEWKSSETPDFVHHITAAIGADPEGATPADHVPLQHRLWSQPVGVLGGLCVAVVTMFMVASPFLPWPDSSHGSHPANAATISSPANAQSAGELTTAAHQEQATANNAYQLYLGAYPSELSARLLWAGLEADDDTMLLGLVPQFERSGLGDSTLYHLFAGTLPSEGDADRHCDQLREQRIACVAMVDVGA